MDQSYTAPGFSVNFFAENTATLPHVMSSGDIICLHRVFVSYLISSIFGLSPVAAALQVLKFIFCSSFSVIFSHPICNANYVFSQVKQMKFYQDI